MILGQIESVKGGIWEWTHVGGGVLWKVVGKKKALHGEDGLLAF